MPRFRFLASFVAIASATSVVGCASIWGFEDGTARNESSDATSEAPSPDALGVNDGTPAMDGTTDGGADSPIGSDAGDASPDATRAGDADAEADASDGDAATDSPVDGDAGDPCTVTTPDQNAGIFVARIGNDGPSCGTEANPCLTIQTGLDRASADALPLVYVQQGSYAESISLYPGITLVGGWQSGWTKDTSGTADALVVLQPTSAASTVVATQLSASARLCTLTILSKAQANPGESLYGVFATGPGASLALDDVVIVVSSGGDGVPGDAGAPPDAAASGGCAAGDGGAGLPVGAQGSPGSAGTFTSQGYVAASGGPGQPGAAGSNGVDAGAPPCVTCYTGCSVLCGGNGGTTECGSRGSSGCGGAGGQPGAGGGGGGSSVGIYAWQTTVYVTGGRITAGNGGNGAVGGPGGAGGAGSAGVAGSAGASCTTGCSSCGLSCCATVGQPAGGSAGGAGGAGSAGGVGGGGAGGSSCATAASGDAGAVITTSTTMTTGDAGAGATGAPNGASATECP